jgi:hypothetical protein
MDVNGTASASSVGGRRQFGERLQPE